MKRENVTVYAEWMGSEDTYKDLKQSKLIPTSAAASCSEDTYKDLKPFRKEMMMIGIKFRRYL